MTNKTSLDSFKIKEAIPLTPCAGWPKPAVHYFDRKQVIAVLAAKEINRPLLVRGEPGCGKTQMARAVAQVLKMPLASLVVNERTETEDLFWHYDALRRLSDANNPNKGVEDEKKYLSAGPFWWALDPENIKDYKGRQSSKPDLGQPKEKRSFGNGVLLLIDEIDKADRSVPNSLLEALGNYSFPVPYVDGLRVECKQQYPLIIITTNNEQDLPPAFERRCLVLDLSLPDKDTEEDQKEFIEILSKRGKALFAEAEFESEEIFEDIAKQVWDKRQKLKQAGELRRPGQAEYLDHLEAILAIKKYDIDMDEKSASEALSALTYKKYESK